MDKQKPKQKLPSLFRWILWVLLVQLVLFNISAAFYAHRFTYVYDDSSLKIRGSGRNIFVKTWRLFSGPRQPRSMITDLPVFPCDTVTLKTKSGIIIDAWYAKPDSASKGTVILFHGLMANKGMFLSEAAAFRYLGYRVMLVDFRAHGNSSGHITTIGVNESEEVKLAWDFIVQQGEKNIFLYGNSMGGVVVAKAIADYDLRPGAVFLEMPFVSLRSLVRARLSGLGFRGFGEKQFGFLITLWIGIERGFNGSKYQTTRYVAKINCPVLMQWGAEDTYVLKNETNRIYNAIASSKKKLVIYDKAGHESLLQNDPVKWRNEVESFLSETDR